MEDGDTEKYHPSRVIQDFVFSSRKSGCFSCISLQVYNKRGYFFRGSFVFLCLVFAMLSCLFTAGLWSPEGKGLTSWLLFVMFIVILLLSHLESLHRCET